MSGCPNCYELVKAGRSVLECTAAVHHLADPHLAARMAELASREARMAEREGQVAQLVVSSVIACVYGAAVAVGGVLLGGWLALIGWGLR